MAIYGIEIIGKKYVIKQIVKNGTNPVNCRSYHTEIAARAAAAELGIEIMAIGDIWDLLRAAKLQNN